MTMIVIMMIPLYMDEDDLHDDRRSHSMYLDDDDNDGDDGDDKGYGCTSQLHKQGFPLSHPEDVIQGHYNYHQFDHNYHHYDQKEYDNHEYYSCDHHNHHSLDDEEGSISIVVKKVVKIYGGKNFLSKHALVLFLRRNQTIDSVV